MKLSTMLPTHPGGYAHACASPPILSVLSTPKIYISVQNKSVFNKKQMESNSYLPLPNPLGLATISEPTLHVRSVSLMESGRAFM
jgi:hypothetical protein